MNLSKFFALAVFGGALSLSSAAFASQEADNGRGGWIERICEKTPDPARREHRLERLAERLHLTDAQKDQFKAFQDARAAARKTAVDSICASKPDLHSFEGRLAFRERMLEYRLNRIKASDPKLIAFYNGLDNGQKALFDDLRRRWRHHENRDGDGGRQEWREHHHSHDD